MSKESSKRTRGFFANKFIKKALGVPKTIISFFKGKSGQSLSESDVKSGEKPATQDTVRTGVSFKEPPVTETRLVKEFKVNPEEYEIFRTQFPWPKKTAICDVVIGLDFGTSCTKVVLRTPYLYGNRAFAVPFKNLTPSRNPYLLPSKVWLDPNGEFLLKEKPGCQSFSGIKLNLLEGSQDGLTNEADSHSDLSPRNLAVAYLALVLRFAREWFLLTKKELYKNCRLRWHTNLGLPSPDYDDESLRGLYEKIIQAAWKLSLKGEGIKKPDLSLVFDTIHEAHSEDDPLSDVNLSVIAEVAAAVAGYARSPLRDPGLPGLHLLVDIGAGTLDVCGFVLHQKDGGDWYSLLTTDIQLLGVIKLHENRLSVLKGGLGKTWDPYDIENVIPSTLKDYLPNGPNLEAIEEELRGADEAFSGRCQESLRKTLFQLRKKKDPNSPRWHDSLPVFICGGGRNVLFYDQVLREISMWLKDLVGNQGMKFHTLPKPENLEVELSEDYHRLTVAIGLSMLPDDIGGIDPTRDSPDIAPAPSLSPDRDSRFVSKDQV